MCNLLSCCLQFLMKCNMRNADEGKYISQMSAIDVYDWIKHSGPLVEPLKPLETFNLIAIL